MCAGSVTEILVSDISSEGQFVAAPNHCREQVAGVVEVDVGLYTSTERILNAFINNLTVVLATEQQVPNDPRISS